MAQQMRELDGLRAIAILLVVIGHYTQFWTPSGNGLPLLPYGDALRWAPLENLGGVGVEIFFVISGVLVVLALKRAPSFGTFMALRLIRLWPTLILCSLLTVAATSAFGPAAFERSAAEIGLSMAFLPPEHVGKALGIDGWQWLDGAYWSLWVQIRFFAVIALIYFLLDRSLVWGWAAYLAVGTAAYLSALTGNGLADAISGLMFSPFLPHFTGGIGLALALAGETRRAGLTFVAVALVLAQVFTLPTGDGPLRHVAEFAIFAVVGLVVFRPGRLAFLGWAPLVAVGQASFVLYLLHQHFTLSLLQLLPPLTTGPAILATGALLAAVTLFAVLAFRRVERPGCAWLRDALLRRPQAPIRIV